MDAATQAPVSDDQELAKVLESMNNSVTSLPSSDASGVLDPTQTSSGLQFEELTPADQNPMSPAPTEPAVSEPAPVMPVSNPDPVVPPLPPVEDSTQNGDLETIKRDALQELRPLVDKLDLAPEEKFNTLLLIIRSTDDRTLVPQAHAAAKSIEDESKRAEALLDVIKEIDYFSHPAQ